MINFEDHGSYLYAGYEGDYELSELKSLLKQSAELLRQSGSSCLLVDLSRMQGKVSILERFELGVLGVQLMRSLLKKAAILYRAEEINKFAENVVVNRGGDLRTFADYEAALKWLLE